MGYLHLPSLNLADTPKGTISLWFRLSGDAVEKATQNYIDYPSDADWEIFRGTIPLLTFGRKVMGTTYEYETTYYEFDSTYNGYGVDVSGSRSSPVEPSHIGLTCSGLAGPDVALKMVFQSETRADVAGLRSGVTNRYWLPLPSNPDVYQGYMAIHDISYVLTGQPESFLIMPNFEVKLDTWHHLLVSFDFSNPIDVNAVAVGFPSTFQPGDGITGACKLWFAFDDKNKSGSENIGSQILGVPADSWAYKGPNDVVPITAKSADTDYVPHEPDVDESGNPIITGGSDSPGEYHYPGAPLPLNNGPVGIPASAEYVANVYHVEMAELQIFAGVTLDTGVQSNRRAFIDFKRDTNGTPISSDLHPVDPSKSMELLGKRPEVLMHGTKNWKAGKNTGSLGIADDGSTVIPGGQFTPTGTIKKYTPDPSLSEPTRIVSVEVVN